MTPEELRARAQAQLVEIEARKDSGRYHERPYTDWAASETPGEFEAAVDALDHDPADDAECSRDPFDREVTNAGRR